MNLIVARDKQGGIGRAGGMLVHLPGDLCYFREKTLGKTVIMGYRTLLSLPGAKPLSGRKNIVLTHRDIRIDNAQVCHSVDEVLNAVANIPPDDVFVIGGGAVYEALLPYCRRAYVTEIDAAFEADTFFAPLTGFVLTEKSAPQLENGVRYTFCVYERRVT